ncbi:plant UBX domain-containing protein 11 isoform X2 [Selaginella moellendorffii]|uniref:plant UBX domain-containing protein 11 isoform X2 n=1 Tax=Selaginella moellendorffii TaxID=88036 RepID=UPI000D1C9674|nr:plant UBX domain-containing protein 11 isoform X2 [Selaginella moellendorffii]|eukprot:XP_024530535.1 plant UBX domain-containing protein 11 isoform X2 [Selaginella moellendorffii]
MSQNSDALFFAGSIPSAVATAQQSSKVFLVYIANDGEESARLEETTWRAPQVVSLILEKFVALRLVHGSVDALHFSVLYPISAVPSITAIGYQGVKLWEQNGFITPEELSKRLQYAVDTFQFQVQTAMAALLGMPTASSSLETPESAASSKPEEPTQTLSSSPETPQNAASSKPEEPTQTLPALKEASLCKVEEKNETLATTSDPGDELSKPVPRTESDRGEELSEDTSQMPVLTAPAIGRAVEEEIQTPPDQSVEPVEEVKGCVLEVPVAKKKTTTPPSPPPPEPRPLRIPDKVHLQVKLTDGAVIRREFEKSDTLWTVKYFVDENRTDGNASYAFAVPFPRKIFNAEDYENALVDLDIGYRAVLILVPSSDAKLVTSPSKPSSPTGGMGRWLTYLNPLSYVRGGNASPSERPKSPPSPSPAASKPSINDADNSRKAPPPAKRSSTSWGSNVHTLRHDEDDDMFKRGNTYWNGNATQFGANDNDERK